MSSRYQCPKCGSQDVYLGNKTILGGIGGIYGNRSKDVLRNFCRNCDIEALPLVPQPSLVLKKKTKKGYVVMGGGGLITILPVILGRFDWFLVSALGLAVMLVGLVMVLIALIRETH